MEANCPVCPKCPECKSATFDWMCRTCNLTAWFKFDRASYAGFPCCFIVPVKEGATTLTGNRIIEAGLVWGFYIDINDLVPQCTQCKRYLNDNTESCFTCYTRY